MRNLLRLNNAANRIAARQEWERLARIANDLGRQDLVDAYDPGDNASWRKIDKAIAELRRQLLAIIDKAIAELRRQLLAIYDD